MVSAGVVVSVVLLVIYKIHADINSLKISFRVSKHKFGRTLQDFVKINIVTFYF